MKTIQTVVIVMLISLLFVGTATSQVNEPLNQHNKAVVDSIIELSGKIHTKGISRENECKYRSARIDKYESYYAQPVSDPTLKLLYAVDYFQEALDMEKRCGGAKKTRYDFISWEYFGRMQETIIGAYEKCVNDKISKPEKPFLYRYIHTYENILIAFKDAMQPEALTHFNELRARAGK